MACCRQDYKHASAVRIHMVAGSDDQSALHNVSSPFESPTALVNAFLKDLVNTAACYSQAIMGFVVLCPAILRSPCSGTRAAIAT